jgi:hypothetical protein
MILFYQHLGKLFFSIAAADDIIREEEVNQLKKLMQSDWLALDDSIDQFGTDAAFQIEVVFDWLVQIDWRNADEFLTEFKLFKQGHEHLFTDSVNKLILKTAFAIAESFSGKNKSEMVLISQIERILVN